MSVDQLSRVRFEHLKPLVGSKVIARREDLFDPEIVAQIPRGAGRAHGDRHPAGQLHQ